MDRIRQAGAAQGGFPLTTGTSIFDDPRYVIRMPANKNLELEIADILFRPAGRPSAAMSDFTATGLMAE